MTYLYLINYIHEYTLKFGVLLRCVKKHNIMCDQLLYIYMCVCVCVCVSGGGKEKTKHKKARNTGGIKLKIDPQKQHQW